jgi:hypothetical protein
MAVREGFRRIRVVGVATLVAGCLLDALALGGLIAARFMTVPPIWFGLGAFGLYLSTIAAVILLGAWILEGFFAPGHSPHA